MTITKSPGLNSIESLSFFTGRKRRCRKCRLRERTQPTPALVELISNFEPANTDQPSPTFADAVFMLETA